MSNFNQLPPKIFLFFIVIFYCKFLLPPSDGLQAMQFMSEPSLCCTIKNKKVLGSNRLKLDTLYIYIYTVLL